MKNKKPRLTKAEKTAKRDAIEASRVPTKLKRIARAKVKLNKANQWEYLGIDNWVKHLEKTGRFPNNKITCCECKHNVTSMFGNQLQNYLKKYHGNARELLETYKCRPCRGMEKAIIKAKAPKEEKEKKPKVVEFVSREEYESRKDAIRATLPVFKIYSPDPIDLVKDKKGCAAVTSHSCWRPDIFLDAGCMNCHLQKNCACPIKDLSRVPDNRPSKFKRAIMKAA